MEEQAKAYEIEEKFDEVFKKHQELIQHAERQEEEIEILKEALEKGRETVKVERIESESLQLELESLEENFDEVVEVPEILLKPRNSFSLNVRQSFKANPRTIGVFFQQSVSAEPKKTRKNPGEEYFTLITQAIKLNSPYMDVICIVSPKSLYDLAIKNDIPFHKWHVWVEKQLNASYLQNVFRKDSGKKSS